MSENDFQNLLPDFICDVALQQGYRPTGQLFQLNSYENRVYEIGLEDHKPIIAKFYRPNRWSELALQDEHQVLQKLVEHEIPVVKPLNLKNPKSGFTLGKADDYYFCFYPKFGGHEEPDLSKDHLEWLGRVLARLHNVMQSLVVKHRLTLNCETYGDQSLNSILDHPYLPDDLKNHVEDVINQSLDLIDPLLDEDWQSFAVHGDCHLGNVLWNQNGPTLVDFDDMVISYPIQDLWMLFHGSDEEKRIQKEAFFTGYETFRDFDFRSFILVEPLRTLRMIRHAAWIGQRYKEEIFKKTFPYYIDRKYWETFLLDLKEQLYHLQRL